MCKWITKLCNYKNDEKFEFNLGEEEECELFRKMISNLTRENITNHQQNQ